MLSVIIPAYNEKEILLKTANLTSSLLEKENIPYELIFVNDGSTDKTWDEIIQANNQNNRIKGLNFSRNFGKEAAIYAGLAYSNGDCCAVMDCDLQHPPEILIEMYRLWEQGYEVVEGIKASRGKENPLHTFFVKLFYGAMSSAIKIDMSKASDFKLLDRKAVDIILTIPEKHFFFRALSSWIGFKSISIQFYVKEREAGKSKWSALSLFLYAVRNITSFSTAPMQIVTTLGILFFVFAIVLGIRVLYMYFTGTALGGFTTVILLLLIMGSILMISLGIIGHYIAKIYEEIKGRPRYIVSDILGDVKKVSQLNAGKHYIT